MSNNYNYIDLYGNPSHANAFGKLTGGFMKPFMTVLSAMPPLYYSTPFAFLLSLPILTGTALRERFFNKKLKQELSSLFGETHEKYYIDKKPTTNSTPTKPEHLLAAFVLKSKSVGNLMFKIFAPIAVWGGAKFFLAISPEQELEPNHLNYNPDTDPLLKLMDSNPNTSIAIFVGSAFALATGISYYKAGILKDVETAYRFHKVVRHDWIITDEPPKELSTSKSKTLERIFGIFAPPATGHTMTATTDTTLTIEQPQPAPSL